MYCIKCGSLTNKVCPEGDNRERDVCNSCGYIHYNNPKIIVGVLPVTKNFESILLCKRSIDPGNGKWTIPSGFMELKESLEDGVQREAKEEANLKVKLLKLYSTYSITNIEQVYLIYLGKILNSDYAAMDETSEVKLFDINKLPWDEIAFSSVSFILNKYITDYEDGKTFKFHSNYREL
ncbi:MAG: ADP-ribose pyrophosphatase [Candidatus Marinimicrobia bacterium]|nr:ADP-ribose pyrophosphatase [Candidatus Neomarinimicrobiota bacterium]